MSGSIEDRIVSIKFDNAQFESKISDTLASLDALNTKLSSVGGNAGVFDGLNQAAAGVDLGGMANGVDHIASRFTALGAVAFTAIQNITGGVLNFVKTTAQNDILGPIISGGEQRAQNLQQAKFQFEGLGINVKDAMQSSLDAVKGTAFGLDEAAKTAAQFGASGISAGQDMTNALKGVAGAAALTGSSFSDISQIFTSAAGVGKVTNLDLQEFGTRGLNAAAAVAKVMGTTEANIHQMATNGTLDFKTFAEAMNVAFGKHATDANQTYTGSLANLHAAFARLGATFFTPELVQQRDIFNALTPVVDNVSMALQPLIQAFVSIKGTLGGGLIKDLNSISFASLLNVGASMSNFGKAITNVFDALEQVFKVFKEAFKEIFPTDATVALKNFSEGVLAFSEHLKMGANELDNLKSIFAGFFSVISIGFAILKGIASVIGDVAKALFPAAGGLLKFGAASGDFLTNLKKALVDGGKIQDFFNALGKIIVLPIEALDRLGKKIASFFAGAAATTGDKISGRFDNLSQAADKVGNAWDTLTDRLQGVFKVFDKIGNAISTWFHELGSKIAASLKPTDFNSAIDAVNVGLLGAITAMLAKFFTGGVKFGFGGGLVTKVNSTLANVTRSLRALQTQVKAKAILEIAAAVAILAASVIALSLVNSAALTKALAAISVGFGELIGALTLLDKFIGVTGGFKLTLIATTLIGLAIAIDILAIAIAALGHLNPTQLAQGLGGVAAALALLVGAVKLLDSDPEGLIAAATAMGVMSLSLLIIADVVKKFGNLSFGVLAKGLGSIALALGILVGATLLISADPAGLIAAATAIGIMAVSLTVITKVVKEFGGMSWKEIGKGLVGIAASLLILVGAMYLISTDPAGIIAGAIAMGIMATALTVIAGVIKELGKLSIGTLAKSIGAITVLLVVLAAAMFAMQEAALGAVALIVVATALKILADVLTEVGKLSITQVITAIVAVSAFILVLAGIAALIEPLLPALVTMGVALGIIGVAFALFGVGAFLTAAALQLISEVAPKAAKSFVTSLEIIISALPKIAAGIALFGVSFLEEILKAAPLLIKLLTILIGQILDTVIKLVPKIADAFIAIVTGLVKVLRNAAPELIATGIFLFEQLLSGIANNIGDIVGIAVDILVNFVNAVTDNIDTIVTAGASLIVAFLGALGDQAEMIVGAAVNLVITLATAIVDGAQALADAATNLIITFATALAADVTDIINAGVSIMDNFLLGILSNIQAVIDTVTTIITTILITLANAGVQIAAAGTLALITFLTAITSDILLVVAVGTQLIIALVNGIAAAGVQIANAATNALIIFIFAIAGDLQKIIDAGTQILIALMNGISKDAIEIAQAAFKALDNFLTALDNVIKGPYGAAAIAQKGIQIGKDILSGVATGLADALGLGVVKQAISALADKLPGWLKDLLGIHSPSTVFAEIGGHILDGLVVGITNDQPVQYAATTMGNNIVKAFNDTLGQIPDTLNGLEDFNPTITPVLDLSKVTSAASGISKALGGQSVAANLSLSQAATLSSSSIGVAAVAVAAGTQPQSVTFEQTINAPTALSTNDIYRQTKSQIILAKEALGIS